MSDLTIGIEIIIASIIAILVISNPVSTSAIFIALTKGMNSVERRALATKSVRYSIGILVFFSVTGLLVFQIFGFGIGAFRMAGGVLLFSTAVGMLNPKDSGTEAEERSKDIALIPLSIPFTAGPGTIVTVVVLMSEAMNRFTGSTTLGALSTLGVYIGIFVTIFVSFNMMTNSERIDRFLGEGGRNVVTRLMGLLVMAISIQFVINGVMDILPDFARVLSDSGMLV
ncbi:MAG: MarC family protein [Euryarchaeota archaeon]|nr:MarC family protein [Euryarchaeota archaeon]